MDISAHSDEEQWYVNNLSYCDQICLSSPVVNVAYVRPQA